MCALSTRGITQRRDKAEHIALSKLHCSQRSCILSASAVIPFSVQLHHSLCRFITLNTASSLSAQLHSLSIQLHHSLLHTASLFSIQLHHVLLHTASLFSIQLHQSVLYTATSSVLRTASSFSIQLHYSLYSYIHSLYSYITLYSIQLHYSLYSYITFHSTHLHYSL